MASYGERGYEMMGFPEMDDVMNWLADESGSVLDDIIDSAMSRQNVRKNRRPHVRRVIEEACEMVLERARA